MSLSRLTLSIPKGHKFRLRRRAAQLSFIPKGHKFRLSRQAAQLSFILLRFAIDLNINYRLVMRCRLILVVWALLFASNSSIASQPSERESQITAAYLYHFTKFTEWPAVATTFHYCVYDDVGFTDLLRQTYQSKTIGEASIEVKNISTQSKLDDCQLIYFPGPGPADFLKKASNFPILSVGIQKDFIELGGIIYLFEENQKLRFYINNAAAANSGLKINSQLLRLSKEP
ncbi:YfiR family protein [Candidatus Methylobacter oryzae]|uniref:YfiR family protein n=1 Tax=Candidatus Methylobacter oryzae TaxID=2497749 RepID=A0ABY3CAB0_9GAMM|nr:YfiR family protein [Candidatus Methylobacter oryzae]TRW94897.1 YfiR family protein [Candidatus Methylobacter oryzae]